MELTGDLQSLIKKAWDLQVGISDEINKSTVGLCRLCSENGRFCGIVETPFQDKERLIAIRDSLKQVQDLLLLLQNLRNWQPLERYEALTRLEESRLSLVEKLSQSQGTQLDVMRELNACFNNGKTAFDWKFSSQQIKVREVNSNVNQLGNKRGVARFWNCCFRMFYPWRWHNAFGVAAKLVIIFASVSSMSKFYYVKQKCLSSHRRRFPFVESITSPQKDLPPSTQDLSFNVFYGRG